jgi:hypothetical protein
VACGEPRRRMGDSLRFLVYLQCVVIAEIDGDLFLVLTINETSFMKKFLSITLLLTAMFLTFSACSSDDEDEVKLPDIVGIWFEATETPGDYVSMSTEVTWIFRPDMSATQRFVFKINNVTTRESKADFTYLRKGNNITLTNDGTTLAYEVIVQGDIMTLGNSKDGYFRLTRK